MEKENQFDYRLTYFMMTLYVVCSAVGYTLVKLTTLQMVAIDDGGALVPFLHPIFQSSSSFVMEFVLVVGIFWPISRRKSGQWFTSNT